ncbi:hypothetical protein [Microcoleus sp. D2_18a_B4]
MKEEGRGKKEEGRRKRKEGRGKKEEKLLNVGWAMRTLPSAYLT